MRKNKIKTLFLLHLMLMVYSLSGICSKLASKNPLLSIKFCVYYGCVILLLGGYAIGWQQIIKRLPLTTAFANKAVTVVWGLIWGKVFFQEKITISKMIGIAMIVCGVVLFAIADGKEKEVK